MKRIIALLLAIGLLLTVGFTSAYAEPEQEQSGEEKEYLYKDKVLALYADYLERYPERLALQVYDEPYYHYDSNGEIDWALIRYRIGMPLGPLVLTITIGRVVISINNMENVPMGLSVYDVKTDEILSITDGRLPPNVIDYSSYEGFEDAFVELAESWKDPIGNITMVLTDENTPTQPQNDPTTPQELTAQRGDADRDGDVSVLDATCIQRYLVKLVDEEQIDLTLADYDGDGDVTVLDATAIQRFLVGLT